MRKRTDTAKSVASAAPRLNSSPGWASRAPRRSSRASLRARRGAAMEIDASEVVEIGTPCLQVLLSAAASWRADGWALAVVEPSSDFFVALGHLGLGTRRLSGRGSRNIDLTVLAVDNSRTMRDLLACGAGAARLRRPARRPMASMRLRC